MASGSTVPVRNQIVCAADRQGEEVAIPATVEAAGSTIRPLRQPESELRFAFFAFRDYGFRQHVRLRPQQPAPDPDFPGPHHAAIRFLGRRLLRAQCRQRPLMWQASAAARLSVQEFQQALREQQERLRPALGGRDPAMLDSPEMRRAVLDGLVNQRLIGRADRQVADRRFRQPARPVHSFRAVASGERESSRSERYEMLVASQGMSKEMFEMRVRKDLAMQQTMAAVNEATLPGRTAAARWIGAQLEEREIAEVVLRPEQYASQVKLAPDAVKNFYEANKKQVRGARAGACRVRRPEPRQAGLAVCRERRRNQGLVPVARRSLQDAGRASRQPYPDRGQERCAGCRRQGRARQGGGGAGPGEEEPGRFRQARQAVLAGPRFGRARRRPRLVRPRHDGAAFRAGGLCAQGERGQRRRCVPISATTSSSSRASAPST